MTLLIIVGLVLVLLSVLYWNLVRPQLMRGTTPPAAAPAAATAGMGAPASAPAATSTKKWYWKYFWAILILVGGVALSILVVLPIWNWLSSPSTPQRAAGTIPLASSPQSEWPKLIIPAGGRSETISVPTRMHIVMTGNDFRVHNVYVDGSECTFGDSCVAGPLVGNYVTNEAQRTNTVIYAFAPD